MHEFRFGDDIVAKVTVTRKRSVAVYAEIGRYVLVVMYVREESLVYEDIL